MKKFNKTFILILMCCLFVNTIFLSGCFFYDEDSSTSSKITLRDVNMSVEYHEYLEYYSVSVTGIAENISGRNLSYVTVEFALYDEQGFKIGTADAYTDGLQKGEAWRFEATSLDFSEVRPTSFKLIEITSW